jgi:CheY-like chemotaxis protein
VALAGQGVLLRDTVLILESEARLREALAESLAPCAHQVRIVTAADEAGARRELDAGRVNLLVAGLASPLLDGFTVAAHALQNLPQLPVVLLARELAPPLAGDPPPRLRCLREPLDFGQFRDTVLRLLDHSPEGHLTHFSLVGFLQFLALEGRSAVVVLELGGGTATLVVAEGELVDAEAVGLRGETAVFEILASLPPAGCDIVMETLDRPVERTIDRPLAALLLEAAARRDEQARVAAEGVRA